jgi:hypothetical protein
MGNAMRPSNRQAVGFWNKAGRLASWRLFAPTSALRAEDIVPGLSFRQRDGSIWEVVREVRFQVHPIPHVELVKIGGSPMDAALGRKVISINALLDSSLYSLSVPHSAAAE